MSRLAPPLSSSPFPAQPQLIHESLSDNLEDNIIDWAYFQEYQLALSGEETFEEGSLFKMIATRVRSNAESTQLSPVTELRKKLAGIAAALISPEQQSLLDVVDDFRMMETPSLSQDSKDHLVFEFEIQAIVRYYESPGGEPYPYIKDMFAPYRMASELLQTFELYRKHGKGSPRVVSFLQSHPFEKFRDLLVSVLDEVQASLPSPWLIQIWQQHAHAVPQGATLRSQLFASSNSNTPLRSRGGGVGNVRTAPSSTDRVHENPFSPHAQYTLDQIHQNLASSSSSPRRPAASPKGLSLHQKRKDETRLFAGNKKLKPSNLMAERALEQAGGDDEAWLNELQQEEVEFVEEAPVRQHHQVQPTFSMPKSFQIVDDDEETQQHLRVAHSLHNNIRELGAKGTDPLFSIRTPDVTVSKQRGKKTYGQTVAWDEEDDIISSENPIPSVPAVEPLEHMAGKHGESTPKQKKKASSATPDERPQQQARRPFSKAETDSLIEAVHEQGKYGKWAEILVMYSDIFQDRTSVNLKDKWRNLVKSGEVEDVSQEEKDTAKKSLTKSATPQGKGPKEKAANKQTKAAGKQSASEQTEEGKDAAHTEGPEEVDEEGVVVAEDPDDVTGQGHEEGESSKEPHGGEAEQEEGEDAPRRSGRRAGKKLAKGGKKGSRSRDPSPSENGEEEEVEDNS